MFGTELQLSIFAFTGCELAGEMKSLQVDFMRSNGIGYYISVKFFERWQINFLQFRCLNDCFKTNENCSLNHAQFENEISSGFISLVIRQAQRLGSQNFLRKCVAWQQQQQQYFTTHRGTGQETKNNLKPPAKPSTHLEGNFLYTAPYLYPNLAQESEKKEKVQTCVGRKQTDFVLPHHLKTSWRFSSPPSPEPEIDPRRRLRPSTRWGRSWSEPSGFLLRRGL